MRADDDGFIGNPKRIQQMIGASGDDLKLLIAKRFVLVFDDGVIVIKHWRMHNTLKGDRYNPTTYQDELKMLTVKQNKAYTLTGQMEPKCFQNASTVLDIDSDIHKVKDKKNSHFVPPTLEEVQAYCKERNNHVDPQKFFDYFNTPDTNGRTWIDSKGNKVKNWKQKIITWEKFNGSDSVKTAITQPKQNKFNQFPQREYTPEYMAELERKLANKGL
jgi:hypothetical protein